jgi:predicted amidohydrolase
MADLLIALWTYNSTGGGVNTRKSIDVRFNALKDKVEACANEVTSLGNALEQRNAFQAVFVAPEYLFTAVANSREALSSADVDTLYQKLVSLSSGNKKILLAPGTVFYQEAVITTENRRKAISNLLMAEASAKQTLPRLLPHIKQGWTTNSGVSVPSLADVTKEVVKPTSTAARARNVSYLFLNGERQASYDKHADFIETKGASPDQLFFIPGTRDQCPEIGGFKFGVEICFDHANGILARRGVVDLDFHLVMSDWANNSQGHMAMAKDGYFAHASTNPASSAVWKRKSNGSLEKLTPYKGELESDKLAFFRVPIPYRAVATVVASTPVVATVKGPTTPSGVKLPPGAVRVMPDPTKKTL